MKIVQSLLATILLPRNLLNQKRLGFWLKKKKTSKIEALFNQINSPALLLQIKCLGFTSVAK